MNQWRRVGAAIHPWRWRWRRTLWPISPRHISAAAPPPRCYWGLPYKPLLPHKVYGIVINYIDHGRPHLFRRPSPTTSISPRIDGKFFLTEHHDWWSVLDHCNGLLLYVTYDWGEKMCVCNPATQRWTILPKRASAAARYAGAYLAFDPAMSPHYEVFLIPAVPKADDGVITEEQEWPPSTWKMNVFSSRTGQWEERAFVRKGEPAGTVQDVRLDRLKECWEYRQQYAVFSQGVLYVQYRRSFVLRLVLSKARYRVLKTPMNYINSVKPCQGRVKKIKIPTTDLRGAIPYLGRLKNVVHYGLVYRNQLRIWMLNESCEHIEWLLKYEVDIELDEPYRDTNGREVGGSWTVEEGTSSDDEDDGSETLIPDKGVEWDSDNDDIITPVEANDEDTSWKWRYDILGFHPSKKVVFIADSFSTVAYHLDSSKFQYLGNARPSYQCYYGSFTNGIYESFVYTPCMIGDLLHGDGTRSR